MSDAKSICFFSVKFVFSSQWRTGACVTVVWVSQAVVAQGFVQHINTCYHGQLYTIAVCRVVEDGLHFCH